MVFLDLRNCSTFKESEVAFATVYLDKSVKYDKAKSNEILNNIELTSAKDLIKSVMVYMILTDNNTHVEEDKGPSDLQGI